jgi:hypothetical protein
MEVKSRVKRDFRLDDFGSQFQMLSNNFIIKLYQSEVTFIGIVLK